VARRSLCERTRIHAVPTIGRAGRRWRRWTSASGIAQEAHIGDLVLRVLGGHDVGAGTRLRAARATRAGARTRCNFMRTFRWMGCLAGGSGCAADAAANARWRPLAIPRTPWLPRDGSGSIRAAAQGHVRGERAPPVFGVGRRCARVPLTCPSVGAGMVLADADADTGLLESRRPRRSSGESRPATR